MRAFLLLLSFAPSLALAAPDGVASVAVLPLATKGKVNKDTAAVLDDLLLSTLQHAIGKQIRVIGKSDIDALLGFEKTKDMVGCAEVSCAVELAGALGVDSIMTGTIGRLGKKTLLSLTWIEQRQARVLARESRDLGLDEETFDTGMRAAVAALTSTSPVSAPDVATAPTAGTRAPVSLTSLPRLATQVGWGTLVVDTNHEGKPLTIGGRRLQKGLWAHAPSMLVYQLDGNYKRFRALVGIEAGGAGCYGPGGSGDGASFEVLVDDKAVFTSPVLRPSDPPQSVDVAVDSGRTLVLRAQSGGNNHCDHTVWGEPELAP